MLKVEKTGGCYFANTPPEGATENTSKHRLAQQRKTCWNDLTHISKFKVYFDKLSGEHVFPMQTHSFNAEHVYSSHLNSEAMCLVFTHTVHSLREGVKAVGLLGVGEGHSHAWCEWGVKNDSRTLIARSQVHRWDRANALTVHDHILWSDAIPARKTQNIWISCFGRWLIGYLSCN